MAVTPLSLDTRNMLGTQVKNNTITCKAILIAPSDNRNAINLEDLYAWARPINEPRHKGQSLWIGSTMLRKKMPPLNPPPLTLHLSMTSKSLYHSKIYAT